MLGSALQYIPLPTNLIFMVGIFENLNPYKLKNRMTIIVHDETTTKASKLQIINNISE